MMRTNDRRSFWQWEIFVFILSIAFNAKIELSTAATE
jgi:hypothetical protein